MYVAGMAYLPGIRCFEAALFASIPSRGTPKPFDFSTIRSSWRPYSFFVLYLFPFFSLPIGGQHFYVVVIAARFASLSFLIPFFLYLSLLWAPASGEAFYLSWFRYKRFRGSGGGSGFPLHCPLEARVSANFLGVTFNRPVGEMASKLASPLIST